MLYNKFTDTQVTPKGDETFSGSLPTYELDGSNNLKPEYDAATVNWGDGWRMPTAEEFAALANSTFWAFDLDSDMGYYVFEPDGTHNAGGNAQLKETGLSKDNALLFFPFTGVVNGVNIEVTAEGVGPYAHFFSSSFKENTRVKTLDISWENLRAWQNPFDHATWGYNDGFHGCVIRPVKTAPAD